MRSLRSPVLALLLAAPLAQAGQRAPAARPRSAEPASLVRVSDPELAFGLRRAVDGARARLSNPACRRVFSDFRDAWGRTLQAKLETLSETPEGYLAAIFFYDGDRLKVCANSSVHAATQAGDRVVRVCPQFLHRQRQDPRQSELIVLHEALHTLGLGENPPSSQEITRAIAARCGR